MSRPTPGLDNSLSQIIIQLCVLLYILVDMVKLFVVLKLIKYCFQTMEEREWFARRFETKNQTVLAPARRDNLAKLMLKCQVRICSYTNKQMGSSSWPSH